MKLLHALYESFKNSFGVPAVIVGLVLSLGAFFYAPTDNATIPIKYIVVSIVLVIIGISTLVHFGYTAFFQTGRQLPEVIEALPPSELYKPSVAILLLRESEWFGSEALVSIYRKNSDFEVIRGFQWVPEGELL